MNGMRTGTVRAKVGPDFGEPEPPPQPRSVGAHVEEHVPGKRLIEVLRNLEPADVRSHGTRPRLRSDREQSRDGLARSRDDDLLALLDATKQTKKLGSRLVDVHFHDDENVVLVRDLVNPTEDAWA